MNFFLKQKRSRETESGIAVIFVAAVFGLLLGFFMMVANTGLLIYQKIRLQTAVDLGAYSAASVQASYLGNAASGEDSILGMNQKIIARYGDLLDDLQFGTAAPWPVGFPEPISCMAACQAANIANGMRVASLYEGASKDLEEMRAKVAAMLAQLPEASRKAAEQTIKLNIPELDVDGGRLGGLDSETTNEASDIASEFKSGIDAEGANPRSSRKKNAVLSFSSKKGIYLANVVASVPHSFAYFGPACFDLNYEMGSATRTGPPSFYCTVNGAGFPGGAGGFMAASVAFARAIALPEFSGNIGHIPSIADSGAHALRLQFVPNVHKPSPFAVVSAEWNPENGTFMNMENSLGAKGSLFPKATRLVAVAAAEPFGGNLASLDSENQFGVKLQSIRRTLLDPRMTLVRDDYPDLYEYFSTLGPRDEKGELMETAHETIRRFLH